jgi:hypothetical protein
MSKVKYIAEGGSSNRPPLFDGSNYYFWKGKMELFLRSQDNDMWQVITDGDFVPTTKEGAVKEKSSWSTDEKAQVLLNSKARLFLSCALTMEESERVDECKNAKEVWDTLRIHHEGTSHVKETRIDIGVRKFEVFEMSENETIDEMYARFTTIVNEMRSLGKAYSTHDRIRKILRCLPSVWRPMVTAITQAKDLKTMNLEDLIGSLRAHEVVLQGDKPVKKVKTLALKASQQTPLVADDDVQEPQELEEVHEEEAEDELALISKRIQRMMLRRNQIRKKFPNTNNSTRTEADKSQVTCYGCNKTGHYKSECPDIKKVQRKPPFKKKAMITWDDLEESEPQEDEEANMGLMAQSDDEEEVIIYKTDSLYKDLENKMDSLLYDSNFLTNRCHSLIKELSEIKAEKETLQNKYDESKKTIQVLQDAHFEMSEKQRELNRKQRDIISIPSEIKKENILLKKEVETLKNDLTGFIKSTETFQNILGSQNESSKKSGLGFKDPHKIIENFVPKAKPRTKCYFCDRYGHNETVCHVKKKLIKQNKINLSSERSHLNRSESSQKAEKAKKSCSYCNKSDHTRQNVTIRKDLLEELTLKDPTLHGYLKFLSCQM